MIWGSLTSSVGASLALSQTRDVEECFLGAEVQRCAGSLEVGA
jgi:hypothetical protein